MYPRFAAALLELGNDHDARGEALEVSGRTIARYLDGDLPEPLVKLLRQPHLLRALAEDAEQPPRSLRRRPVPRASATRSDLLQDIAEDAEQISEPDKLVTSAA